MNTRSVARRDRRGRRAQILRDVVRALPTSQGYSESNGLLTARRAVVQYYEQKGIRSINVEDVYLGNGVSELIQISLQAMLNAGDEVLVPAPDYPLWTAAVRLAGGIPVHYHCDRPAGYPTSTTSPRASPTARRRSSSSTPTTRRARSIRRRS